MGLSRRVDASGSGGRRDSAARRLRRLVRAERLSAARFCNQRISRRPGSPRRLPRGARRRSERGARATRPPGTPRTGWLPARPDARRRAAVSYHSAADGGGSRHAVGPYLTGVAADHAAERAWRIPVPDRRPSGHVLATPRSKRLCVRRHHVGRACQTRGRPRSILAKNRPSRRRARIAHDDQPHPARDRGSGARLRSGHLLQNRRRPVRRLGTVVVDARRFHDLVEQGRLDETLGALDDAKRHYRLAYGIYRGRLLASEPLEPCFERPANAFDRLYVEALGRLTQLHAATGHLDLAREYAREYLAYSGEGASTLKTLVSG